MFKAGFIRKIEVRNFVTYDYVQMYPGPNLNMIVGPNGTGKSTMVAAVILGLGGNPKTVGRSTRISEYVKHECESATINIYLQGEHEKSYVQITRHFDKNDKSTWQINGRKCLMTEVIQCTKQLNIQVDNLCQFLPQDRVADFAKLNKRELLKQTQIALCREDLIEKQNNLVSTREDHKHLSDQVKKLGQKLQEAKDANSRLEGKVINFNKMLQYKEKIIHIDRKIAWMIYEESRIQLIDLKTDKSKAQEVLDKYRNELKPMEKLIINYKERLAALQKNASRVMQQIRNLEGNLRHTNENIDAINAKVREIEDEINMKLAEIDQRSSQIQKAVSKLEDMKQLHKSILAKVAQSQNDKQSVINETSKCTGCLRQLRAKKDHTEQDISEEKAKLEGLQNEVARIENIKQARLEQLRRLNENAYTAVMWLRNNRHQFKGEIFEPIMLELNVLDKSKAKYVESMIPFRDRVAFTCTNKSDMNVLIRCLREEQKLSVNVLHSSSDGSIKHQPAIPLEQLRKYGFYTYMNMLFSAPDPIMNYLCQTYKLHNIPIGDATTNSNYEQVPNKLVVFFSDKFRFAISYSKYTREKITRQSEIKTDGGFSLALDFVMLENLRGRCNESENQIKEFHAQIQNVDAQITKVQEKIDVFREKLAEIQKQKQQADTIEKAISVTQQNINAMKNNNKNPNAIREEGRKKRENLIGGMRLLQETLRTQLRDFKELIKESDLNSLKLEWVRQQIEHVENRSGDTKRQLKDAENTFNVVLDKYNATMQEAKSQLHKAKGLSNGFTPADTGFNEFKETYDQLPSDLEELNTRNENLNSKIACLNTADDGELEEYENRRKQIGTLAENIESSHRQVGNIETTINRLQKEWLEPLNELIFAISSRFSAAFERMGCAGEVTICQGDDEQNFANYGISIKVTYRSGEPLQELNSTVQSGGERAVATAAFMLSLQELTPVPFRCVDEINQGMDASNERRIFELIVQTTCQANTSQYFLITPKLIPNLLYPRQILMHFVHNGPFICKDKKWAFSELCNPQKIN